MRSALRCWPEILERIRHAGSVVLFLDFDGTIAPVRPHPSEVWPDRRTERILRRLGARPCIRTYLISGRPLADLRARAGGAGIRCLGVHGSDRGRGLQLSCTAQRALAGFRTTIEHVLRDFPGVWIEDKTATLAVHYRRLPEALAGPLERLVRQLALPQLRVLGGQLVWEIMPREAGDKGIAARAEWLRTSRCAIPIYIGNDGTDEPAFETLAEGITIRVGSPVPSRARYYLRDPAETSILLERLWRAAPPPS
jgi:trehalose 6-phosphate phosphatase